MNLEMSSDPSRLFCLCSSVRPASANCLQINMTISKSLWVLAQKLATTICQTDSPKHTGTHPQICLHSITNCWFASVFLDHWICLVLCQLNYISTHSNLVQNGEGLMMLKLITLVKKSRECRREREDAREPSGLALWTSASQVCHVSALLVKIYYSKVYFRPSEKSVM